MNYPSKHLEPALTAPERIAGGVAHIQLSPGRVLVLLLSLVLILLSISLPLQFMYHQTDIDVPAHLVWAFDFDRENNLPTWLSTVNLLLCALTLFVIWRGRRAQGDPQAVWWAGLGLVFLYLSIDEAASLHEATVPKVQALVGATGALYAAWVIPAAIVLAVFGLIYLRFFLGLPRRMQGLLLLAGTLFVGGAIGLEMLAWHYRYPAYAPTPDDWEAGKDMVWALLSHLEEMLEMIGVAIFLYALLSYLAQQRIGALFTVAPDSSIDER